MKSNEKSNDKLLIKSTAIENIITMLIALMAVVFFLLLGAGNYAFWGLLFLLNLKSVSYKSEKEDEV